MIINIVSDQQTPLRRPQWANKLDQRNTESVVCHFNENHRIRCNVIEFTVSFGRKFNMQGNGEQYVEVFCGKNHYQPIRQSCSLTLIINSISHSYDLKIRLHARDLCETLSFCRHIFTMKSLSWKKKKSWTLGRKQMRLSTAHLHYPFPWHHAHWGGGGGGGGGVWVRAKVWVKRRW